MRTFYTIILLFCATLVTHAQTKTWIGPSGGSWGDMNNWSPTGVPGSDNVIIPSGSLVNVDGIAWADSLTVQSGATVNKLAANNMTMTHGFFQSGSVLNIFEGNLVCGGLVFDGTVNALGPLTKGFRAGLIEVNNTMTIEAGSGPFTLRDNTMRINPTGTLNLPGDGILDIAAFYATLDNHGLIQKTGGTGDFVIDVNFVNNGGTINVNSGNLVLPYSTAALTNGLYNVNSGSSMIITAPITQVTGTLTGLLDGPLVFQDEIRAPTGDTAIFNFTGSTQVEWAGGQMGYGDFINQGLITITGTASANHTLRASTLLNNGVIDVVSKKPVTIGDNTGLLHNSALGTINLLDSNLFASFLGGLFLNEGSLIKAASGKNADIRCPFTNDGGTISVLGDTLLFTRATTFTNGQYDVDAGAATALNSSVDFNGTLTGQLAGPLMLNIGPYNFSSPDTAVFNFTGSAQVDWYSGTISGGNLKNMGTINAKSLSTAFSNQISSSHIVNEGLINVNGLHGIYMYAPSTLLNTATGVIDMQVDNFIECGAGVTNLGLFKKSGGTGVSAINGPFFHNDPALVHVEVGTLSFASLQPGDGDFAGAGTLVMGNYVVEGDVSPGNSPGTLSIIGDYTSSPIAMLNVELNGNIPGVDFDVLAIDDDAIMKGGINITMGYAAAVNDQFEIVTATSVDSCFLPATVTSIYSGNLYTYDVICNTDNVTLGLISVGLDELEDAGQLSIYPNPMSHSTTIDLGTNSSKLSNTTLVLLNGIGQTVRAMPVQPNANFIEVERGDLPAGLYHVQLVSDAQVVSTVKLLIE